MATIEKARLYDTITRAELAKMMSQYAVAVLKKSPDTSKNCSAFEKSIQEYKTTDLYEYMITACQLGLMGISGTDNVLTDFMPNQYVTRAEF
jgi:hypothetical protein